MALTFLIAIDSLRFLFSINWTMSLRRVSKGSSCFLSFISIIWYPTGDRNGVLICPVCNANARSSNSFNVWFFAIQGSVPPLRADPWSSEYFRAISEKSAPCLRASYMESIRTLAVCCSSAEACWLSLSRICAGLTSPSGPIRFISSS